MEKKGNRSSRPRAACEKMYKAAIRTVSRRVERDSPASPTPSTDGGQLHIHSKRKDGEVAEVVPIILDHSSQRPPTVRAAKVSAQNFRQGKKDNPKFKTPHVNKEQGKKSGEHVEDKFTDYINRAKIKLRTMSRLGDSGKDAKKVSRNDHSDNAPVKDKFTEYINRAKMKVRSTSGIGVGRYKSSK